MYSSDSDSDSEWNREMFIAVCKKQGKGRKISEQHRCEQIQDCIDQGADINAFDKNSNTVLDIALIKGYQEVATFLRDIGAQTAADIGGQLNSGPERLADNLGKLEIASLMSDPINQQSIGAGYRSTTSGFQPVDNEQPSTSRSATLSEQNSAPSPVTWDPKHKLFTDNENDVVAKKRRLMPTTDTGNTDTGSISSDEDLHPEENEDTIMQTAYFDPDETYAASGLKQTLHGVVYQWKHLMLVLNRAWKKGYSFRLSTEMDAAEKFDDLVLEYVDGQGNKLQRFVQLKHKKDNTKTVSVRDLLDVKDGEFSMLKYFVSWRKIKECSSFDGSNSKTFTLCTNIGLDLESLREANIDVSVVGEPDDFLEVTNRVEQPPRYKIQMSKQSELYHILKSASDVHRLARELAERVCGSKDIHLNTDIMKRYHAALAEEVIDVESQTFSANFITNNNLSARAENFREILLSHTKKLVRRGTSETDIWKGLAENKLNISTTFGSKFELTVNPVLTHVGQFSNECIKLLNNASTDNVVKIDRRIYSKRAKDQSIERIFADNIDKLAGHVLITENKKIKFSWQFMNDVTQLLGNIEEFRDALKTRLGSKFDQLDRFEFEINNFKTCTEEELFSTTELPHDDISDGEILDFLNGFILAVDQPDESELGKMIRHEIGDSRFDLPDAKFITDSFQIEILDWFKETGKQSVFLANKNAKDIFNEIEGRLSSLVTMDLRSEYPEKLEKWGIKFKSENPELWKFIRCPHSPSDQILAISSGETLLTALRVYQTLKSLRKIGSQDGFIFVRLERLFETKILDQVLRTFEWQDNHNLLIVDCEANGVKQYSRELWKPICEILRKNGVKKMILIIQENQDSTIKFRIRYNFVSEKNDDFSIVNLEKFSQQKLLERKIVKFQGQAQSLGSVLGIKNFDNIEKNESTNLRRLVDSHTLVQLIKGMEIKIGNEVEGLGPVQDYYIPRRIIRHVVIKAEVFKAPGITDLFAISGVDAAALRKLLGDEGRLRVFHENIHIERHVSEYIILENRREENQFKTLRQRNLNRNIHWLQGSSGKFIWIRSSGVITDLIKYKDISEVADNDTFRSGATHPDEHELVDHDSHHKIVIFSDTAGMGKSTVLTSLAEKMRDNVSRKIAENRSPLLIIKINLTEHTKLLAKESKNRTFDCNNINGAVDFLVDKLAGLDKSDDLQSLVYKTMVKDDGKAALFFDGFDEISPTYGEIVTDLLRALVKLPIKKLFVTTRPHTSEELEEKLGIFSHRLEPFSRDDQRNFLKKFWKSRISSNDCDEALEERLEMHAEGVMNLLVRSIDNHMTEFTGVPLQTRMVAEIYQYREDSKVNQPKLPEKIDTIDLYEQFVDKKNNVFFTEKQPGDPTNLAAIQSCKIARQISLLKHQMLALDAIFNDEAVCALQNSQLEVMDLIESCWGKDECIERAGIVTLNVDDKPHFIHRTFAEYFVAIFLMKTLKADSLNQDLGKFFLAEFFVEPEYKTIRAFLNCLLSREVYVVCNKSWKLDLRENCQMQHHKTVYHVAAKECNVEIVKFFLNRLDGHSSSDSTEQQTGIDLPDKYGYTPLAIAIHDTRNFDLVKCFVDGGANIHWKNFSDETLLHEAVMKTDNLAVVKYLCEKDDDINFEHHNDRALLLSATNVAGSSYLVKHSCERKAMIHCQNEYRDTPLHKAANRAGNLDVLKYLCEKVADVNCRNKNDETPLHHAVDEPGKLDMVKYLCDKGAEINCYDKSGYTPLRIAVRETGNLDIVKYLCEKGANYDCRKGSFTNSIWGPQIWTALHDAACCVGTLDIVNYLCEKGADIHFQDIDGRTPLHVAASEVGNLQTVQYLCNMGADINRRDHCGLAPLHFAAEKPGNVDIVKYLCSKGDTINFHGEKNVSQLIHGAVHHARKLDIVEYPSEKGPNINFQYGSEETPLHIVANEPRNSDTVKYSCEVSADVDCQDENGITPLMMAVSYAGTLDIVKYLCEAGADVNHQYVNGMTPLMVAVCETGNFDTVKYLCEAGANVNCQDENCRTPLMEAAHWTGNFDMVKYLCEAGANVNCHDKNGRTPLMEAASWTENFDTVEYSCETSTNVNYQDENGRTPLTVDRTGNFDMVKYLCEAGATINCQDRRGETPLILAVSHGKPVWIPPENLDMVKYLCDKGAEINCRNNEGETPLHRAVMTARDPNLVKYLVAKGANINARTKCGVTPLHSAVEVQDWNVFKFLLYQGADTTAKDNDGNTALSMAKSVFGASEIVANLYEDEDDVNISTSTNHIRVDTNHFRAKSAPPQSRKEFKKSIASLIASHLLPR